MRTKVTLGILIAALATVFYTMQRPKDHAGKTYTAPSPMPKIVAVAAPSERPSRFPGFVSTEAHDPEFVQRVLPVVREFFATLDRALIRLSERAIKMPQAEAERIIEHVANTFGIDRSKFEKPEIFPEKMFHYDLGIYTVQYRKKGSDPINQLNYPLSFSVRSTSPTTAVLVMYSYSGQY